MGTENQNFKTIIFRPKIARNLGGWIFMGKIRVMVLLYFD